VAQRIITRVFGEILKFPEYFWAFQNKPIGGDVEALLLN
jgi:hypothetical protein